MVLRFYSANRVQGGKYENIFEGIYYNIGNNNDCGGGYSAL